MERIKGTLTLKTSEKRDLDSFEGISLNIKKSLETNNLADVAHILACTLPALNIGEEEFAKRVFSLGDLKSRHNKLWVLIKPDITPEFVSSVYNYLIDECGWEIDV